MGPQHRGPSPTAPADLWGRPEMVEALAERDMATVLKLFRRWTGASQTDIGIAVGIPQSHVSDIERGTRKVTALDLFERFADGLRIPRRPLGLADADPGDSGINPDTVVTAGQQRWMRERKFLGTHRAKLPHVVSQLYPESSRLDETGILALSTWLPTKPIDLDKVQLRWQDETPKPEVNGGERETRRLRPLVDAHRDYTRYHRAMRDLAKPRLFENRLCYRLLGADATEAGGTASLTLGEMCYFDMIDVGEALSHEAGLAASSADGSFDAQGVSWERLPFRRLVRDPFELLRYPLMISISTLTIRHSKAGTTFFLLRRNPAKVAIAGGMLSVFPTGVFQPASVLRAPESPDFNLWRNVMREYSEEYLGNPEHDGGGQPIDYDSEEPFRSLNAARSAGKIRVFFLGIGVDALNYVGDVLTVAIYEAETFDRIFGNMVDHNDEGEVDAEEFTFDQATVDRLLASQSLAPSGAGSLHLAWLHRDEIFRPGWSARR